MTQAPLVLPYGITLKRIKDCTVLQTRLSRELVDNEVPFDAAGEAATHAIESLLMALYAAGIDLSGTAGADAVQTAVDAVGNYLSSCAE